MLGMSSFLSTKPKPLAALDPNFGTLKHRQHLKALRNPSLTHLCLKMSNEKTKTMSNLTTQGGPGFPGEEGGRRAL